jgi:predicted nucleic acid-binding protein
MTHGRMIVVADTSPLNYLILIEQIALLEAMYGRIAIPTAVHNEMLRMQAPASVRSWALSPPGWIEIHSVTPAPLPLSEDLDAGEREAIALALLLKAPILLIDETIGREEAQAQGLRVIGTLGILRDAQALGLLDMKNAIQRLQTTSFRIAAKTLAELLPPE